MKKLQLTALIAGLALALANTAHAQLIVGTTYNSGYSGVNAITPGLGDPDFIYTSAPASAAAIVGQNPIIPTSGPFFPGGWITGIGAQWLSPDADQSTPSAGDPLNVSGTYVYATSLSTNYSAPTQLTLTGGFATDNAAQLTVAGIPAQATPGFAAMTAGTGDYASLTDFDYTFTVAAGPQTTAIDFTVDNFNDAPAAPNDNNPTGLIVSDLTVEATPEPSSWMLACGAGLAFFCIRRRQAKA